jgi:hypothetical protein
MLITHKQTLISTTLNKIIFGFCVGMYYQWQSTNQFKKKIDFVTIKFHLNENIEWHLLATWIELDSNTLNGIWIQFNLNKIEFQIQSI